MIENVPTSDDLNRAALRLYFTAWTSLITIATDFDQVYPDDEDWTEEKAEYLRGCQSDMQSCCTLIQQSNELALKARVAEVSPYLLLFRNDRKLSIKPEKLDFSDLRTLDATDLLGAVNSFCTSPLSDVFITDYNDVRKLRNKIVHLGSVDREFDPDAMLKIMVRQFIELWPGRGWLAERYKFAQGSRYAAFHDGKYSSAEGEPVPQALWRLIAGGGVRACHVGGARTRFVAVRQRGECQLHAQTASDALERAGNCSLGCR